MEQVAMFKHRTELEQLRNDERAGDPEPFVGQIQLTQHVCAQLLDWDLREDLERCADEDCFRELLRCLPVDVVPGDGEIFEPRAGPNQLGEHNTLRRPEAIALQLELCQFILAQLFDRHPREHLEGRVP